MKGGLINSRRRLILMLLLISGAWGSAVANAQQGSPDALLDDNAGFDFLATDGLKLVSQRLRANGEFSPIGIVPPAPAANNGSHAGGSPGDRIMDGPSAAIGMPPMAIGYDHAVPSTQHLFAEPLFYDESLPDAEAPLEMRIFESVPEAFELPHQPLTRLFAALTGAEHFDPHTELDEDPIGPQPIPDRPPLLLETNEYFLAPGWLEQGIELPSGAIWRPSIWIFGTYRIGISYFDNRAGTRFTEWAHRLDLFGQINLSGTERVLVGLRPLDEEIGARREFNGYDFHGGNWIDGWNGDIQTLFFEGDFGEVFPFLDPYDSRQLDYGFSVGRMPLLAQQGLLINEDRIDALTLTRNTLYWPGNLNLRITGVYAWDEVNRNNNTPDDDAQLFAILTESDFVFSTVNADVVYVNSRQRNGDLIAFGISGIQRFHGFQNTYNSSLHVLASYPLDRESPLASQGELLFSQFSWTPHHSQDLIYLNVFWAIDQFTSPARGTLAGGPLGQTGILFSAPGLGRFGAPLSNRANDTAGASIGYQVFLDETRQQVLFELGGRADTQSGGPGDMIAAGIRYQRALSQHWIFLIDGFIAKRESFGVAPAARVEFFAKF